MDIPVITLEITLAATHESIAVHPIRYDWKLIGGQNNILKSGHADNLKSTMMESINALELKMEEIESYRR
jgi:hypothetical protein